MKTARDYLVFPLDVPTVKAACDLVALLSDCVGMFKVGLELFLEGGPDVIAAVRDAGAARIFLDLKLHDIPATVARSMQRIGAMGIDYATVHCGESKAMLEAAVAGSDGHVGVLGVTVLTSVNRTDIHKSGFKDEFIADMRKLVVKRALMAREAGCCGVVCSGLEVKSLKALLGGDFLAVTPGIRPAWEHMERGDQERVVTPSAAVKAGSDYVVVGRPIRDAQDPRTAALHVVEEIETVL